MRYIIMKVYMYNFYKLPRKRLVVLIALIHDVSLCETALCILISLEYICVLVQAATLFICIYMEPLNFPKNSILRLFWCWFLCISVSGPYSVP